MEDRLRKIENVCLYMMAFCLVLDVFSIWAKDSRGMFCYFGYLIGGCGLVALRYKKVLKKEIIPYIGFVSIVGIYNIVQMIIRDGFNKWFSAKFIILLCVYCILVSIYEERKKIFYAFSNVVFILAVMSLFFYIFGTLLHIIPVTHVLEVIWGANTRAESYMNLHYNIQPLRVFGTVIWRNTGIFLEGPMYSCVLTMSIMTELFLKQSRNKWSWIKIGVFTVCVITTFSATGCILLAFCSFVYILYDKRINKNFKKVAIALVIVLSVVAGWMVLSRITSETNKSFSVRIDDYRVILDVFKDHPLLGVGYQKSEYIRDHYMTDRGWDYGGSNGFFGPITQCGLVFFVEYIVAFIGGIMLLIKRRDKCLIAFVIGYFLIFATNMISLKGYSIYLMAIGLYEIYQVLISHWNKHKNASIGKKA